MLVEVCANSLQSALNAQRAGADRIELCSELAVGGLTPSYGLLKAVKEHISLPVNVLIRPRSGDFTYSDEEFKIMKRDIDLCVDLGFAGIVSGVLHEDFTLDEGRTAELIALSKSLNFTFHRAFDWVDDSFGTLSRLETMGVDNVLTSGQQNSAVAGFDLLTKFLQRTNSCTILPGGGIRPENVHLFVEAGFGAVHLSGVKFKTILTETPKVTMNASSFLRDDSIPISDFGTIQKIVRAVK